MRFPSEDLGRIRRREITATLRPVRRQKMLDKTMHDASSRYEPGRLVPISRVDQLRTEFPVHDVRTGERLVDAKGEPRSFVLYEPKAFRTDEYIEITTRTREPLNELNAEVAEACGFADLEQAVFLFRDQYGGREDQSVWVFEFRYATDTPRFLSRPDIGGATRPFKGNKREGHTDYVRSPADAIDDLEPVDDNTLAGFAEHNRAKDTLRRLDMTAARLEDKVSLESQLAEVRRLARERGIDIRSTERLIQRKLDEVKRKLRNAA